MNPTTWKERVRALDWRHPYRRVVPLGVGVLTAAIIIVAVVWLA
jgi:hypothetical protein